MLSMSPLLPTTPTMHIAPNVRRCRRVDLTSGERQIGSFHSRVLHRRVALHFSHGHLATRTHCSPPSNLAPLRRLGRFCAICVQGVIIDNDQVISLAHFVPADSASRHRRLQSSPARLPGMRSRRNHHHAHKTMSAERQIGIEPQVACSTRMEPRRSRAIACPGCCRR